jgi:hypothetical protein
MTHRSIWVKSGKKKLSKNHFWINMDAAGVVRRVINKPRDIIPRNPALNPDVNIFFFRLFCC